MLEAQGHELHGFVLIYSYTYKIMKRLKDA